MAGVASADELRMVVFVAAGTKVFKRRTGMNSAWWNSRFSPNFCEIFSYLSKLLLVMLGTGNPDLSWFLPRAPSGRPQYFLGIILVMVRQDLACLCLH